MASPLQPASISRDNIKQSVLFPLSDGRCSHDFASFPQNTCNSNVPSSPPSAPLLCGVFGNPAVYLPPPPTLLLSLSLMLSHPGPVVILRPPFTSAAFGITDRLLLFDALSKSGFQDCPTTATTTTTLRSVFSSSVETFLGLLTDILLHPNCPIHAQTCHLQFA